MADDNEEDGACALCGAAPGLAEDGDPDAEHSDQRRTYVAVVLQRLEYDASGVVAADAIDRFQLCDGCYARPIAAAMARLGLRPAAREGRW